MMPLIIHPPKNIIDGEIDLPASKSIANRLLIIKALSDQPLSGLKLSDSADTVLLHSILEDLPENIDAGDAGTAYRFLTGFLAAKNGHWILNGSERMLSRPIGPLVDALIEAGADINYMDKSGYPPLKIRGKKLEGGLVTIDGELSSQFITSILLVAPYMEQGLKLVLSTKPSSIPYIQMTIELMRRFGINVRWEDDTIVVDPGAYEKKNVEVEADWSAAAFFFELCALSEQCSIQLKNLAEESIQGDSLISKLMNDFKVNSVFRDSGLNLEKSVSEGQVADFRMDCNEIPDLVPALVCTAAGLGISASFSGIYTLQIKESNRIIALQTELRKLGLRSDYNAQEDMLHIHKGQLKPYKGILRTYNDHRIAMALAPLSLLCGDLHLEDGDVVGKSFPSFWEQLEKLGFIIERVSIKNEI